MDNITNNILHANEEIAASIYKSCLDMDGADYIENSEEDIKELKSALEWLDAAAQNEYNRECFKTLYLALQKIFYENM